MSSIVLIHIGDEFPSYMNDCIEQIKKFNACPIFLVANRTHQSKVIGNVTFIPTDILKASQKHEIFNQTTLLDRNFRGGFWKYATERFFYLEEVIELLKLEDVFHLENDNLIYCNLENYLKIFVENYEIGAIFDNDIRAVPGFVYFKNVDSIADLTSFIISKNGPNDMELLSLFKRNGHKIKNLPILPSNYDMEFKSLNGQTTGDKSQYSLNFDKFNSIFDGAAIGQYLGGVDTRNPEGSIINFINESCLFNVSKFRIEFENKIPYLFYKEKKIRINNLHIHSKNLRKFM